MQDRRGFIWFATDNGVSRFDGSHFKNYSMSDGLSDNDVLRIIEDDEGRLWFLTFNGKLSFYQNDKIYNSTNNNLLKKLQFADFITSFFQDSKKNIWINSIDHSLVRISPNGQVIKFNYRDNCQLIWEDKKGKIRFLASRGIYQFDNPTFSLIMVNANWKLGMMLPSDTSLLVTTREGLNVLYLNGKVKPIINTKNYNLENVLYMLSDKNKNVWLGTLNGAVEFKGGIISSKYEHHFFENTSISTVFTDKDNNLWFTSTGSGVFIIHSSGIRLYDEKSGLVENNVTAFAQLNDSSLMVGLHNGSVQLIDGGIVKNYHHSLVSPSGPVLKIEKDLKGTIWVLTEFAIFRYNTNKFTKLNTIWQTWNKTLFTAHDNTVWIGWGRGLKKITKDSAEIVYQTKNVNRVHAIVELNDELILGTDRGLIKYKDGIAMPYFSQDTLLIRHINALAISKDSTLWIGTNTNGLLSLRHGVLNTYTIKNHMLSNKCNDIIADSNKIFVATNNGLNILTKEGNLVKVESFSIANGLVSNHINQILKKDKNTVMLATDQGLVEFDIRDIPLSKASMPYINSLVVNDNAQPLLSNYRFKYDANNIHIEYGAINFNSASIIYYRY